MIGKTISHYKVIEKVGPFLKALIPNKRGAYKYYGSPILILFVGLGLSLALFAVLRNFDRREAETAFKLAASEQVSAIQKSIEIKIVILESMSSLDNVSEARGQRRVYEFTKPLVAHMKGVQALSWLPRVPDSRRVEFETSARQRGFVDFQITERETEGALIRASQRDEYFPISDPGRERGFGAPLGFDLASDPKRAAALYRARDTGAITATVGSISISRVSTQVNFLLFLPVYRKGVPVDTVEERRRNLRGVLVGVFRISDTVEDALSELQPKGIDLLISDQSAPEGERFLYFHSSRTRMDPVPVAEAVVDHSGSMQFVTTFEVGGRSWAIRATPAPFFLSSHTTGKPLYGLMVGMLFTGLFAAYLVVAARRSVEIGKTNRQLKHEIIERRWIEEELTVIAHEAEEARSRFEGVLRAAPDPIVGVNQKGQIVFANDQTEKMFGYPREELLGSSLEILLPEPLGEGHQGHRSNYSADPSIRPMSARKDLFGRRKDGHLIPVDISLSPLQTEDGLVTIAIVHDITRRKQDAEKLLQYQVRLRDLASESFFAEERERRRIATELHDRIGQTLAVSRMKLGALRKRDLSGTEARLSQELDELIGTAIQNIRSLTFELSPPTLYELGLEPTLEWLAEQTQRDHGIVCQFENDQKPLKSLNDEISVVLYQSVRELLMNAVRHGQASHVKISLWEQDSGMGILVKDDGVGFDLSKIPNLPSTEGGFGLFNIRERLEALGGQLLILSGPNRGTFATLLLPWKLVKGKSRDTDAGRWEAGKGEGEISF